MSSRSDNPDLGKPAITDLPLHPLLRERWSPRSFSEAEVSDGELRVLLEAARWAPSCFNDQPWAFLVASRRDEEGFERLLGCLSEGNRVWAARAAALLVTLARARFRGRDRENRHSWHDVGLAAAQLTAQATALGIAVHQMAGFDAEAVRERCGVPAGWSAVTAIAVGRPGPASALPDPLRERELAPRSRLPAAEIVHSSRWGSPPDLLPE